MDPSNQPIAYQVADVIMNALRVSFIPPNSMMVIFTISIWTFVCVFVFIPKPSRRALALGVFVIVSFLAVIILRAVQPPPVPYDFSIAVNTYVILHFTSCAVAIIIMDQFIALVRTYMFKSPLQISLSTEHETKSLDAPEIEAKSEPAESNTAEPSRQLVPVRVAIPEVASSPQTTALKLKRSQRDGMMGKVIFILDARMELSAEDAALVKKYRLGDRVVYESEARKKHAEATKMHAESTRDRPSVLASPEKQAMGAAKSLYRVARAGVSAAMTALSLRITIDSLSNGVHVECKSLEEMTEAENAIVTAAKNLKGYLANATGFDGREELIEL
jgi:hypothetical protein